MASPAPTAAYKDALLALQAQQRARLSVLVQQTEAMLHSDWARGMGAAASLYRPVLDEYAKALSALRIANDDPAARLSLDWLTSQNSALKEIEQSVRASALTYGNASVKTVEDAQLKAMNAGLQDAENLTQEALFPASQLGVNPAMLFNRPNPDAISQFVGRAGNGNPLGDLFANFPQEATSAARQALLMGLATGANPVSMAHGISQALGISRSRAITIARTEVLGSYRQAAHETYRANSDVLGYWLWSAGGNNPCAMCAGMDGTLHDLSEDLSDHVCGKCAPVPVTKPWSDILGPYGIDASGLDETSIGAPGNYTSISEKFDSYSPARQREIIGTQTGYEAYKRGEITLKDFIGVRPAADGFPSSYYQKSLKELQIPTRQAKRLVEFNPELAQKFALGKLRYSELGQPVPEELMPAWAKRSDASRIVYQILRNGLPYDMESHERGLLITNLAEMLKTDLPISERAAVERQLQALGGQVERLTLKSAKLSDIGQVAALREGRSLTEAESAKLIDMYAMPSDLERATQAAYSRVADRLADNPAWSNYLATSGKTADQAIEDLATIFRGTILEGEGNGADVGAMMMAVRDEFGLSNARVGFTESLKDAEVIYAQDGAAMRAYVRAVYDGTQQYFHDEGIGEITLFRGGSVGDKPFNSFSVDRERAAIYANKSAIQEVRVSVDRILGLPQSGIGNAREGEVIVLGRQATGKTVTELSAARAEVRDAQRALRAAEDAVRADYSRSPQGLLGNRLLDDQRIVSAQARLEAARARVQELKDATKAAEAPVERSVNLIPDPTFRPHGYEYDPEKNLAESSRILFGRELSPSELGSLVGAPDGSYVTYSSGGGGIIQIKLYGPSWDPANPFNLEKAEYSAQRILYRDEDGRLVIGNTVNAVRDDLQGQGIGADIFVDQVQSAAKLGVDEIHTFAAGGGIGTTGFQQGAEVGYYVWPRFGYIGKLPLESRQALRAAADTGQIPQEWANFRTIQQLMQTQAGRDWWKINGDSLDLTFNLKPNSLSMRLLKQYLAEKGKAF